MGGPRGWEIPFPPFLTHPVGEKSPHGWPPWVGNPFPTLLDTSHGQEIPFPPFGDTLYTFAFYFLSMKKTTITILIILAIPIALFALRSGRDDSTAEFVNVRPDAIPSRSIYPGRGTAVHPKLIAPNYQIIAENNLFRPLGWKKEAPPPAKPAPTPAPKPIVEIPPAPPPLTYTLVLTGIVQNGSDRMAVIEDRQHNEGAFLRRGEMLKDVLVRDILAEHIKLVRGETTVQLFLGESIEYGIDGRLLFDTTGTAKMPKPTDQTNKPSPPPVGGASLPRPSPTGGDGQSLIERMRERRRRELNQ